MKNYFVLLVLIIVAAGCNSDAKKLDKLNWLKGKWTAKVQGNDVVETWRKDSDSLWVGESAFIKEGKTLFTEVMAIRVKEGKMQFVSAVSDQNEAEEVSFEEISWTDNKIVFENKEHDFPQQITYELKDNDHMAAFISGDLNGSPQRIDFKFTKVK